MSNRIFYSYFQVTIEKHAIARRNFLICKTANSDDPDGISHCE